MVRHKVIVLPAEDFCAVVDPEQLEQTLIECDVPKLEVFDEIGKAHQLIKDGGDVVPDLVFLKKTVVLHAGMRAGFGVEVKPLYFQELSDDRIEGQTIS